MFSCCMLCQLAVLGQIGVTIILINWAFAANMLYSFVTDSLQRSHTASLRSSWYTRNVCCAPCVIYFNFHPDIPDFWKQKNDLCLFLTAQKMHLICASIHHRWDRWIRWRALLAAVLTAHMRKCFVCAYMQLNATGQKRGLAQKCARMCSVTFNTMHAQCRLLSDPQMVSQSSKSQSQTDLQLCSFHPRDPQYRPPIVPAVSQGFKSYMSRQQSNITYTREHKHSHYVPTSMQQAKKSSKATAALDIHYN